MDTIGIEIISVTSEEAFTKKGDAYNCLVATFKNLNFGKVEQKKIMPFGESRGVKDALEGAAAGSKWTITRVKNGNFWNWTEAVAGVTEKETSMPASNTPNKPAYTRDFETREERANRQVLIVRQSSLSSAVATLTPGAKNALDPDAVLALAERYTQYVFGEDNMPVDSPDVDA